MTQFPPSLKKGDTIALVCIAGYMAADKTDQCIKTLKKWGYKVKKGKTIGGKSKTYFSGTDQERLRDLQSFLDDESVAAVLCARGGYGTTRILDDINWKKFKKKPKWIIGFSDITILHGFMLKQLKTASIHGPMANAFNQEFAENPSTLSLKDCLEGKSHSYLTPHHQYNRFGKAKAMLVGGNLCMLAHATGSNAELNTDGEILFLEDVGEQLYNIDRMMLQLKRAGKLTNLKGLIVGGFSDTKDTERAFGKTAYEIIYEAVKEYDYPTCYGFPVSHEEANVALVHGGKYVFVVNEDGAEVIN